MRRIALFVWIGLASASDEVGSKVCAGCHAEIYQRYSASAMARTSGRTGAGAFRESFARASFEDAASGAAYRVSPAAGGFRMEFSREASGVRGHRVLEWFIGSGKLGRSYLFSKDGFLFQAPVSYYSTAARWDVSPGYQRRRTIDLTRQVEAACLRCHATRLQPVEGWQNRFAKEPFQEAGVGCERCHGGGRKHVEEAGKGPIVNPVKLQAEHRDSVCAQCHLTGAARIATARAGSYEPGKRMSDYIASFVWSDPGESALSATSHFEKLHQSACKKGSGDKLWCGSCHDPHGAPAPSRRVAHYRERCMSCHQQKPCTQPSAMRQKVGNDCTACHMPKGQARAVEHTVFTDHSIPRRKASPAGGAGDKELRPFWNVAASKRELGLAYAIAGGADESLRARAIALLEQAEKDVTALAQLAQLYADTGAETKSAEMFEQVLAADPDHVAAAVNLGIHKIKNGAAGEAIKLWERALTRSPALSSARVNLAVARFRSNDAQAAEAELVKALEYDPDNEVALRLLAEIRANRR